MPRNCSAINALLLLALLLFGATAQAAQVAGTVSDLSGPLLAKKADGKVKILSQNSTVEPGDLLVTEKETYARIKFIDNSEVTLRPSTQFRIDSFSYAEDKPQNDSSVFSLIRGGLRAVTGALGKRSRERASLNTPAATIGIRGTIYIAEYIPPEQSDVAAYGRASLASAGTWMVAPSNAGRTDANFIDAPLAILPKRESLLPLLAQLTPPLPSLGAPGSGGISRAPGLYVQVLDGLIHVSNQGGSNNFSAGQFGFTPSFKQPPVVLPLNPGIQFTPPPSFSVLARPNGSGGASGTSAGSVDCEVR